MADATKQDHYNGLSLGAESIIVVTTCAISFYNSVELLLLIFVTFKTLGGLYFWSLFLASFAVIPYTLGYILVWFVLAPPAVGLAINNVGWWVMVSGQSFVLYSRLHLVVNEPRILRLVLAIIIVDAIIFHVPTTILNFCANFYSHPIAAARGYKIYEKVQMTGFCIQEFIISGIYIWKTFKLLNISPRSEARWTTWQLFSINVIIVIMDIGLLAIEYCNLRVYEQVFKGVIYSVKLKLEYAILGKLVSIVKSDQRTLSDALVGDDDPSDYVNASRTTSRADSPSAVRKTKIRSTQKGFAEHHENPGGDPEKAPIGEHSHGPSGEHRGFEHAMSTISSTDDDDIQEGAEDDLYAAAIRQVTKGSA